MAAWPENCGFKTTLISNRSITSKAAIKSEVRCMVDSHYLASLPGTIWINLRMPSLTRDLGATHFLGIEQVLPIFRTEHLVMGLCMHDLVFHLYPETMALPNRLMSALFVPKSIQKADHIFWISKTTKSDLVRYCGRDLPNAIVCYPGRAATFAKGNGNVRKNGKEISLLVVGSIEPRKNLPVFLEAFILAADSNPRRKLNLVSGDAWGNVVSHKVWNQINQHPAVTIFKSIPDSELADLYSKSDCLVFPSCYEGFGLSILEAVGHCSVIANNIPVFR